MSDKKKSAKILNEATKARWAELAGIKDEFDVARKKGKLNENYGYPVNEEDDEHLEPDGDEGETPDMASDGDGDALSDEGGDELGGDLPVEDDGLGDEGDEAGGDEFAGISSEDKEKIMGAITKEIAKLLNVEVEVSSSTGGEEGDLGAEGELDDDSELGDADAAGDMGDDIDISDDEEQAPVPSDKEKALAEAKKKKAELLKKKGNKSALKEEAALQTQAAPKKPNLSLVPDQNSASSGGKYAAAKEALHQYMVGLPEGVEDMIYEAIWSEEAMAHWNKIAAAQAQSKENGETEVGQEEQPMQMAAESKKVKMYTKEQLIQELLKRVHARMLVEKKNRKKK